MVNSTHETHRDQINLYRPRSNSSRMSKSTKKKAKKTPSCIDNGIFSLRWQIWILYVCCSPTKNIYTISVYWIAAHLVKLFSNVFMFAPSHISFPRSCVFLVSHVAGYGTGTVVIAGPDVSNNNKIEGFYIWITVANTAQIQTFFFCAVMDAAHF